MEFNQKYKDIIESKNAKHSDEKVLEVKNLRISFKTDNGKVQAVRGVSFDLYKGETLCIVGESGSGKSVTSKAIMGILSANAIIEGGQIIYEGEDLLKVSEDEFHRIRGHKIGMIFQDPLSSLNPIVKIGKQITETMLINKNELKNRFNDLIAKELVAYKNNKSMMNAAVSLAENEYSEVVSVCSEKEKAVQSKIDECNGELIKLNKAAPKDEVKIAETARLLEEAKAKLMTLKEEDSKAISDAKKVADDKKAAAVKSYKAAAPALKEALKKRKAEAKIEVKQYKEDLTKKTEAKIKELEERKSHISINKDKVEELDKKIKLIRTKYQTRFYLSYFDMKKKTKIKEEEDQALAPLLAERKLYTVELDKINEEEEEVLRDYQNHIKITKAEAKRRAIKVMKEVGIPQAEKRFYQYPFEFSGGMRQRIVIAIALTATPDILICDEPTTALDVTIQAQILELINKLKAERHLSCIFITHDLGVVANMADRVAVMYAGKICEYGTDKEIFFDPRHPYTWALLSSIPDIDSKEKLEAIPGTPPDMIYPPVGDAFAQRNRYAMAIDFKYQPPYFKISDTHYAATWLLYKDAPSVEPPKIVTTRIKKALEDEIKYGK
jgi:oligopeptide transport system ATP-binding protein